MIKNKESSLKSSLPPTSRYCVISLRAVLRCAVENLAMSFKLHIFTHDQDIVQILSKVSIIVYNMYLEASEMCV